MMAFLCAVSLIYRGPRIDDLWFPFRGLLDWTRMFYIFRFAVTEDKISPVLSVWGLRFVYWERMKCVLIVVCNFDWIRPCLMKFYFRNLNAFFFFCSFVFLAAICEERESSSLLLLYQQDHVQQKLSWKYIALENIKVYRLVYNIL